MGRGLFLVVLILEVVMEILFHVQAVFRLRRLVGRQRFALLTLRRAGQHIRLFHQVQVFRRGFKGNPADAVLINLCPCVRTAFVQRDGFAGGSRLRRIRRN